MAQHPSSPSRRRALPHRAAVIASIASLWLLAGCAAAVPACATEASPGATSRLVSSSTPLGTAPAATFPTPLLTKQTEVSALLPGKGAPLNGRQEIVTALTVLNGATGAVIEQAGYGNTARASFVIDQLPLPGLRKGLLCATVGSRVAVTIPAGEGYPAASLPPGLTKDDSIVVVVDILDAYLDRANGTPQMMAAGLPAVVLDPNGIPGISVPKTNPPTELRVADLRTGSGATIKTDDKVVLNYTGVLWSTGKVFDSSWTKGKPVTLTANPASVIEGFATAIIGRKVGSQVIAIVPPKLGYGDTAQGAIPAGSTLVFVIDILGVASA